MYLFVVVAVVVWIVSASTHQLYYYLQNAQIDGQVVGQFLLERRLDAKRILSNSFKCIGLVKTFLIGFSCDCNLNQVQFRSDLNDFVLKIWLLCNNYLQKYSPVTVYRLGMWSCKPPKIVLDVVLDIALEVVLEVVL